MNNKKDKNRIYLRNRKWFGILSLVAFTVVLALLTWFFTKVLAPYMGSTEQLQAFLESYGWKGRFILLGIQVVQVFVALIPGEVVELAAGYAYGGVEGTLLCLLGVAAASAVVFLLVKKVGAPLVETFISREKIRELRFINSENKLKRLVFLLFLIPGTPKDVLTYFVGLTDITLSQFLAISLIARIPSVVSSTFCGQMLADRNYVTAGLVYAVTGALSLMGYMLYNRIVKRRQNKREQDH